LSVGCLWLACLLFFARLFSPVDSLRLYVVQGDFSNQFYPFRAFAANEWRAGRVPLWNPYVFGGHPFLADIQTAVLYPPSFATSVVGAVAGLPYTLLEAEMVAHYLLAAVFAYLLGRDLTGSRLGGTVCGVVFTFSGFLTSYPAQQLAMLESAVWLPLALLLLNRAARAGGRWRAWAVGAGSTLGVLLLAGHTQTALFAGYAAAGWYLWRGIGARRRWTELVGGLALFGGVGLGLAMVVILPAAELVQHSVRATLSYEAAAYGFERRALIGVLLPWWRGERSLYVGVLPLLLAAVPAAMAWLPRRGIGRGFWLMVRPRPSRWQGEHGQAQSEHQGDSATVLDRSAARYFGLLGVVALLLSVGGNGPVFPVLYRVAPGFSLFRDQERSVYLFAVAVAVLAAQGAAMLAGAVRRRDRLPGWLFALPVLAGVTCAAVVAATSASGGPLDQQGTLAFALAYLAAWLAVALGATVALRRSPRSWMTGPLLISLIALDLCLVNIGNNLGPTKPDPTPRYRDIVAQLKPSASEFRVRAESDQILPPNYGAVWKMPLINGDTPFMLSRVSKFLGADGAEWRRWQALNVKFFVSRQGPFDGVELAFVSDDLNVYRVVFSLPRAWAVRSYQVATDPDDALARTLLPANHPGDIVTLEVEPGVGPVVPGARPDARISSYRSQRVEIETSGDGASVLVLADTWYPGWRAWIDGREVPVLRANYTARAIGLPAGEHHVVFAFVPVPFWVGLAITLATLAGIAVYVRRLWSVQGVV